MLNQRYLSWILDCSPFHSRVAVVEKDLGQIGKALGDRDPGRQLVTELRSSCERTSGYLSHATDVLWLYNGMSSQTDRNNLREYTDRSLKQLIKFLTMEVERTNGAIALTNKPEIVKSATELKNLIRESIEILNQNVKRLYE